MTTRTFERRTKHRTDTSTSVASGRGASLLRHLAAFARFALIWLAGYLGVAALLLLAWAFAS